MTEILWGPYQEHHIAVHHGVTAAQFEAAVAQLEERIARLGVSSENSL